MEQKLSFEEIRDYLIGSKAKSEYIQASIVLVRDVFRLHENKNNRM